MRKSVLIGLITLAVVLAAKAVVYEAAETYRVQKKPLPLAAVNFYPQAKAINFSPGNEAVLMVVNESGMESGRFWFIGYYLLPARLYIYDDKRPHKLSDVPKDFIRRRHIKWILFDNGRALRLKRRRGSGR